MVLMLTFFSWTLFPLMIESLYFFAYFFILLINIFSVIYLSNSRYTISFFYSQSIWITFYWNLWKNLILWTFYSIRISYKKINIKLKCKHTWIITTGNKLLRYSDILIWCRHHKSGLWHSIADTAIGYWCQLHSFTFKISICIAN